MDPPYLNTTSYTIPVSQITDVLETHSNPFLSINTNDGTNSPVELLVLE